MYEIDAEKMSFSTLNELIRKTAQSDIVIHNCCGQRYIASGMSGKKITIQGLSINDRMVKVSFLSKDGKLHQKEFDCQVPNDNPVLINHWTTEKID